MDFFDVIRRRRSVREFSDERVSGKDIETCLEAARLAPSATNSQPWRFLVARDAAVRAALAAAGFNQPCLVQAPVITVLLGDRGVYRKRLRRAKELADVGALSPETLAAVESRYQDKQARDRDADDAVIRANCMIAGDHYILAAAALGLGTCWVGMFDTESVAAAIGLDAKYCFPIALIPTGHPKDGFPEPRPRYGLSDIAWNDAAGLPWVAGTV